MNGKKRCISELASMLRSDVRKVGAEMERDTTVRASILGSQISAVCIGLYPYW